MRREGRKEWRVNRKILVRKRWKGEKKGEKCFQQKVFSTLLSEAQNSSVKRGLGCEEHMTSGKQTLTRILEGGNEWEKDEEKRT